MFKSVVKLQVLINHCGHELKGIPVNYASAVCGHEAGPATIRHLILCWSGDHNGICEVGKFIKCGKAGCRRCKVHSK